MIYSSKYFTYWETRSFIKFQVIWDVWSIWNFQYSFLVQELILEMLLDLGIFLAFYFVFGVVVSVLHFSKLPCLLSLCVRLICFPASLRVYTISILMIVNLNIIYIKCIYIYIYHKIILGDLSSLTRYCISSIYF